MRGLRWGILILIMLFSSTSWALDCYQNTIDGNIRATYYVQPFSVPANAQPGDKIWESNDIHVNVVCNNSTFKPGDVKTENIYAWVNLLAPSVNDPSMFDNGYFTFGVTYNGVDYEMPDYGIDTGACIDSANASKPKTPLEANCNGSVPVTAAQTHARVRLFVKLKARPMGTLPEQFNFTTIAVVQFDGKGGANLLSDAKNFRLQIDGINNINLLDCNVNIRIEPESQIVNFGQLTRKSLEDGITPEQPFSISTIKDSSAGCTQKFDVEGSFYSQYDTHSDLQSLTMGNGLLLQITEKGSVTPVRFNEYTPFATYDPALPGNGVVTHHYQAKLRRDPITSLTNGPFTKEIIFKINYH